MTDDHPAQALLWIDPAQIDCMRDVARRVPLDVVDVGLAPETPGARDAAEQAFPGAAIHTDWREAIRATGAPVAIFGSACTGATSAPGESVVALDDAALHARLRDACIRAAALAPVPATVADFQALAPADRHEPVRILPLLCATGAFAQATEALADLGAARTVSVAMRCARGHTNLASRLFDAMHVAHALLGVPDTIDSSVITPAASGALRLSPPDSPRFLRGDCTAHLRFASGACSASLALSDRVGTWFRGVNIVADEGFVRVAESGIEQWRADGSPVDRPGTVEPEPADELAGATIARAIRRWLDPHARRPAPTDTARVLAMCEAALLSARTGQPESPEMVIRMAGAGERVR